jgi:hypothetical protein
MTFQVIGRGFLVVGCLAYVIRVVHIPFNEILVYFSLLIQANRRRDILSDMETENHVSRRRH